MILKILYQDIDKDNFQVDLTFQFNDSSLALSVTSLSTAESSLSD